MLLCLAGSRGLKRETFSTRVAFYGSASPLAGATNAIVRQFDLSVQ